MVVIGGMGTLVGPLVGAFLVYVLSEYLREFGGYQLVVFAFLVVVFARFFREGLWGIARRLALRMKPDAAQAGKLAERRP
jgi:branched-chain amino acid transport system permease protein